MQKGLLIVISGPSGVGKGTVIEGLLKRGAELSVSATTRAPRPGEIDGVHYSFVTKERFREMIEDGEFLEYAEYVGCSYGTPAAQVDARLEKGTDVILDIETKGALNVRRLRADAVLIYIVPPTMQELARRLRGRGTETEEKVEARLARAREELPLAAQYDYIVTNYTVEETTAAIAGIIEAERLGIRRRGAEIERLLAEQ